MNTSNTPGSAVRGPARQRAYSGQARSYDRDTGVFQLYRRQLVEALPLGRGQVVLDVGCGTGLCCGLLRDKVGPRGGVVGIEGLRQRIHHDRPRAWPGPAGPGNPDAGPAGSPARWPPAA